LADLEGAPKVDRRHVAEALSYRRLSTPPAPAPPVQRVDRSPMAGRGREAEHPRQPRPRS
jgi:hypothetical protein